MRTKHHDVEFVSVCAALRFLLLPCCCATATVLLLLCYCCWSYYDVLPDIASCPSLSSLMRSSSELLPAEWKCSCTLWNASSKCGFALQESNCVCSLNGLSARTYSGVHFVCVCANILSFTKTSNHLNSLKPPTHLAHTKCTPPYQATVGTNQNNAFKTLWNLPRTIGGDLIRSVATIELLIEKSEVVQEHSNGMRKAYATMRRMALGMPMGTRSQQLLQCSNY